jgi:hypothetical protein
MESFYCPSHFVSILYARFCLISPFGSILSG